MEHANRWQRGEVFSFLLLIFCLIGLLPQLAFASDNSKKPLEDNVAVPDVIGQFSALRTQGEWIGAFPDPRIDITVSTSKNHFQGIVRAPYRKGELNNIFYVTKSGDTCNASGNECGNYLGTVSIDSASTRANSPSLFGERIGSNLLFPDVETGGSVPIVNGDTIAINDRVVNLQTSSRWKHPGGVQAMGEVLAVPFEQPFHTIIYERSDGIPVASASKVAFYDLRNPKAPRQMAYTLDMAEAELNYDPVLIKELSGKDRFEAGVLAMTRLPDGNFMLMVTYGLNALVATFVSSHDSFFIQDPVTGEYVENPDFEFVFYDVWEAREQGEDPLWPYGKAGGFDDVTQSTFQHLSLINQTDGKLYLVGAYNTHKASPLGIGDDILALFEVTGYPGDTSSISNDITLEPVNYRHLQMQSHDELKAGARHGNGNAGVSVYISPTRELIVYSVAHSESDEDIIRIGEYRHAGMVRSGNQVGIRFRPNQLGEHKRIGVGDTLLIDASAHINPSWVDFYEDDSFNSGNASKIIQMIEAPRQYEDDFDNFSKLDGAGINNGFNDKMTSFFAALEDDHVLFLYNDRNYEDFMAALTPSPGPAQWGGIVQSLDVGGNVNDKLSSSRFLTLYQLLPTENPTDIQLEALQSNIRTLTSQFITLDELRIRHAASRPNAPNWEWDMDDDGIFEKRTSVPVLKFKAKTAGEYAISVRYKGIDQDVDGEKVVQHITVEESPVVVPNIVAMEEKAADLLLRNRGLNGNRTGKEYDDAIPANHILSQSVPVDSIVGAGSIISYVVSKGPNPIVVMPDVIGETEVQGLQILTDTGLTNLDVRYDYHPTVKKGLIFDTNKDIGEDVSRNEDVRVIVSLGTGDEIKVPDVVGLQESTAIQTINAAGLTVGDIERVYHPTISAGVVIEQLPQTGVDVQPGEAIDLIVSKGSPDILGDIDLDGDVDGNDLNLVLRALRQTATFPDDKRDLDGDGMITALDARKVVLLFCNIDQCN